MSLKAKDISRFKKKLEDLRDQLTSTLQDSTRQVRTPDETRGLSQHQADEGSDDFDRAISLEMTSKEFDLLNQVDRALLKIEEGTYGICDVSGDEIPLARLEAIPYATMTVKAQEKFERGLV